MAIYDVYTREKQGQKMAYSSLDNAVFLRRGFHHYYLVFPFNCLVAFLRGFWFLSLVIGLLYFFIGLALERYFNIGYSNAFLIAYIFSAFFCVFGGMVEEGLLILRGWHKFTSFSAATNQEAREVFYEQEIVGCQVYYDDKMNENSLTYRQKVEGLMDKIKNSKKVGLLFIVYIVSLLIVNQFAKLLDWLKVKVS